MIARPKIDNYPSIQDWRDQKNEERERLGRCYRGKVFWYEFTLQEAAKKLKTFDMPIAGIDMGFRPWDMENLDSIAYHIDRVNKVDLNYPIILDDLGNVRDGFHRIVKAMIENKKTIKAVRFKEMPPVDGNDERDNDKE